MKKTLLFALLSPVALLAQGYTSYFTGNTENIVANPSPGICVMGGATEHDNAMIWLLEKTNGGDVVVLRSSGSDGYNDYLYSELGVSVNSVETLVITSVEGATNEYVLDKVANAEMIWFAGGDQYNYVSYFKDNALEDLINNHISVKHAPIGGTSAGMAIMGQAYFSAENGSVTTEEALEDPYNQYMTIGYDDFIIAPFLENVITDSHYDDPDRRGRHAAFLARLIKDHGIYARGIACNEYVAVCIDEQGIASVYGDYPNYEEFAFFLQPNCEYESEGYVETCEEGVPLTWNNDGEAIKVYKVPGTMEGTNYFELNDWTTGSGGTWEHWSVSDGAFMAVEGTQAAPCLVGTEKWDAHALIPSPNPFDNILVLPNGVFNVTIHDVSGKAVHSGTYDGGSIDTSGLAPGLYFVQLTKNGQSETYKMAKK